MRYTYMDSPVGELLLAGDEPGLRWIGFAGGAMVRRAGADWVRDPALLPTVREQLAAYFAGKLSEFDVPLAPQTTPFQGRVLDELRKVPYGTTISYGELARRAGNPRGARAAGMAVARNPVPVVIPCHRVIGADGSLTGFGGGVQRKRWLLAHEQRTRAVTAPRHAKHAQVG